MNFWNHFPPSRPREAKGGIKTASRRGAFAESWWGKRWIEVLEGFPIGARLSRGKQYARQGQVLSVDFDGGTIRAKVQGSRAQPYKCVVAMRPMDAAAWNRTFEALGAEAWLAAALLSGNVPPELEKVLGQQGLTLFPTSEQEIAMECSCPDWSVPCKHLAAVFYVVAEALERDPFLLFELRGMPREEMLARVGVASASEAVDAEASPEPLPDEPGRFWGVSLPHFHEEHAAHGAALLRQAGPFPLWRGDVPLSDLLKPAYEGAVRHAAALLGEEEQE